LGEICLYGEWGDLISSEAKPKISSALADFTLASARISFMREFEFIRKNGKNIFFVAFAQKIQVLRLGFFICVRRTQHHLRGTRSII